MFTTTMEIGLDNVGKFSGGQLNAAQQYVVDRCIELAKLGDYTLGQFMQEFIEEKRPDLRDVILRCWNML